jgi:hypothetical protein
MSDDRETRNAIFTQKLPEGVQPGMPTQTAAQRMKADFGMDIPQETVPLPSKGKTYDKESPLYHAETVDIRAMTAREEDILTSRALIKKGTVISELIRSCLINPAINPLDLLSGDRNALMVSIRVTGYGPLYETEMECTECSTKWQAEFNLGEMPIKNLEIEPVMDGVNLFEFKLPRSGKLVRFKFMTGRDEEDMMQMAEKQKKLGLKSGESNVTTALLYSIVSVDGVEDRAKIAGFVKGMSAFDSLALRNYVKNNEPGIVMKQVVTCDACGHSEEVTMPMGVTFLWPGAGK